MSGLSIFIYNKYNKYPKNNMYSKYCKYNKYHKNNMYSKYNLSIHYPPDCLGQSLSIHFLVVPTTCSKQLYAYLE